jgi:NAD(P)-dependent dehydrogenase (short-subunit alcohol dehydrogenase family)
MPDLRGLPEDVRSVLSASPGDFVGSFDDVAAAVAFAISDDASYVTGADLRVDGGAVAAVRHAVRRQPSCCCHTALLGGAALRRGQSAQPGSKDVVVITGAGGMGTAIGLLLGRDHTLVMADYSQEALDLSRGRLEEMGFEVHPVLFDVSDQGAVRNLAAKADALGRFRAVVHTAGVSPVQASTEQIAAVDLMGTAYVLEEFGKIARRGSVAVCIASMSAYMTSLSRDIEERLATAPISELRELDVLDPAQVSPQAAYPKAKRANLVRAEAAANVWRQRGARAVSLGPGIILTPMGRDELAGKTGPIVRAMIAISAARRAGEPEDVAAVVAFLVSEAASFISGADLLMDGGVVAWINTVRRGGPGVVLRMLWSRLVCQLTG